MKKLLAAILFVLMLTSPALAAGTESAEKVKRNRPPTGVGLFLLFGRQAQPASFPAQPARGGARAQKRLPFGSLLMFGWDQENLAMASSMALR